MRAALICLQSEGEAPLPRIAGRSVAQAQLDFALRCGCDLVVVHGHGAGPVAIGLRHRAEAAGARYQGVSNAQALIGLLHDDDALLVQQPGLWPDSEAAGSHLQAAGGAILVLASGAGQQAGFERIDLDRAWAGALTIPAAMLRKLDALPEDIAPAPALLRIGLQHRLPEHRLPASMLDDGSWSVLRSAGEADVLEQRWLRRLVGEAKGSDFSRRLATLVLVRRGGLLAGNPRFLPILLAAFALMLGGAMAAGWFGRGSLSFALLALAAPLAELVVGTAKLRAAPATIGRMWPMVGFARDAVLAGCAFLLIGGLWYRAGFAALVLVMALGLLDQRRLCAKMAFVADRGVVCLALAALCVALPFELAIIAVAAVLLGANLVRNARELS